MNPQYIPFPNEENTPGESIGKKKAYNCSMGVLLSLLLPILAYSITNKDSINNRDHLYNQLSILEKSTDRNYDLIKENIRTRLGKIEDKLSYEKLKVTPWAIPGALLFIYGAITPKSHLQSDKQTP